MATEPSAAPGEGISVRMKVAVCRASEVPSSVVSTRWPSPVRSRANRAAQTANAMMSPVP